VVVGEIEAMKVEDPTSFLSSSQSSTSLYPSWIQPDPSKGEGPTGFGKTHPYCTDCQKCWNVRMDVLASSDGAVSQSSAFFSSSSSAALPRPRASSAASLNASSSSPPAPAKFVEYLVVEYARDVTLPTNSTQTTQETIAQYLSTQSPAVCITTVGLNDMGIPAASATSSTTTPPPLDMDVYIRNVDDYLALLTQSCKHVVWIGLPAIVEQEEDGISTPTYTNCNIYRWNQAVYALLKTRKHPNVHVMDIWDQSLQTDHLVGSPLHLGRKFYAVLARLFVTLMAGPDMTTMRNHHGGNRNRRLSHGQRIKESQRRRRMEDHPLRNVFAAYE
jgi:hypothetical protein